MKLKLHPHGDRVVVERLSLSGKVIIPLTQHHRDERDHREGRVIAVGTGRLYKKAGRRIPLHDLRPGQRVIFSKWAGSEMKIDGRDVIVMQMADVLAVVEAA